MRIRIQKQSSVHGYENVRSKTNSRCESERSEAMQAVRLRIRGQFTGLRVRDQRDKEEISVDKEAITGVRIRTKEQQR